MIEERHIDMSKQKQMSRTMRIDLIPDVPAKTQGTKRRRIIIKSGAAVSKVSDSTVEKKNAANSPFRELLHGIYDAALITDLNGVIRDLNVRAVEFFQLSKSELSGAFVGDVICGVGAELLATLVTNLEKERHSLIQAYCIRKDKSLFPAEIAVNRFRMGDGRLCFFVRDVTVRRQAEEMLRTEHNAIQNAANGIAIADLSANFEYVNPAFVKMLGYDSAESMVGLDVRLVMGEGEESEQMVDQVLAKGLTWRADVSASKLSGDPLELGVFAACNYNSEGEKVGIVFSFTDLSDKTRAEIALRRAEQQRVMLESLGAACHHLGQPATVLTANLDIIKMRLNTNDEMVNELVDSSIEALDKLGNILRKLNSVNEYRTTPYVSSDTTNEAKSVILEI